MMKGMTIVMLICLVFVSALVTGVSGFTIKKFDMNWTVTFVTEGFQLASKTKGLARLQIFGRGSLSTKYFNLQVEPGPKTHRITSKYIGAPTYISLRSLDSSNELYFKQIELSRSDDLDNKYIFRCWCWVNHIRSTYLYATNPIWLMTVITAHNKGTYTDRVYVKIIGTQDVSRNFSVEGPDFRTGLKSRHVVQTKVIGLPAQLEVGHETFWEGDNRLFEIEKIVFERGEGLSKTKYVFDCDCELYENYTKTIYLSNPSWRVWTHTGNLTTYGSTDADVFIKIVGTEGKSKFHELETPNYDDFENGRWDQFMISTKVIGDVKGVVVGMWSDDFWHLADVQMELVGSFDKIIVFHYCGYLREGWVYIVRSN